MRSESKSADLRELAVQRWSDAEANQVLSAWRESGVSLAGFARQHGFQPQRLFFWKKRLAEEAEPMRLVPATLSLDAGAHVCLRLPDGIVVELSDASAVRPAWLVELARGLMR